MKRVRFHFKPLSVYDTKNWEDFYDEIASDWQEKARRLQARRWHKIRHQLSAI